MVTPMRNPEFIYKVVSDTLFAEASQAGVLAGAPIDLADGYIHFSTAGQLAETLSKHFAGQLNLVLLAVRSYDVGAGLRWEVSRNNALFPHLYGTLPMSAVAWSAPIAVAADGNCDLPEAVV